MKGKVVTLPKAMREAAARRKRFGTGRFAGLVQELAGVIRLAFEAGATASLWGLEGPMRHAIRADLCLQGWAWLDADLVAKEILAEAFRSVNAVRPTWNEGQLEWTIEAGTLIERSTCARCHKPLPEGHRKFCSEMCKHSHYHHIGFLKEANEDRVVMSAVRWGLT
jgi:hypothetical protein